VSVRHSRLEESVDIIRRLWTGETVTHEGEHFTVHNARLFSLPAEPPPILVSGFGPKATDLAARIGDGWVTTTPDKEGFEQFRRTNSGTTQAGVKICWAPTAEQGAETALKYWGHQGVGGQASQDLPMWDSFAALAEANTTDKVAESVACGPDPERAAETIRPYLEVGFDEVYISQMGPDQEEGIRFIAEQVLPLLG
jgi:G6PDH family F420-dependent oxidoreductase